MRRRRPRKVFGRLYRDLQRWRQSSEPRDILIISLCRPALTKRWGSRVQSDPIVGWCDHPAAAKGRQIKCRAWNSVMIGPNSFRPRPQSARHQSTPEDWADLRRRLHLLHPASDAGRLSRRHCRRLSDSCRAWCSANADAEPSGISVIEVMPSASRSSIEYLPGRMRRTPPNEKLVASYFNCFARQRLVAIAGFGFSSALVDSNPWIGRCKQKFSGRFRSPGRQPSTWRL